MQINAPNGRIRESFAFTYSGTCTLPVVPALDPKPDQQAQRPRILRQLSGVWIHRPIRRKPDRSMAKMEQSEGMPIMTVRLNRCPSCQSATPSVHQLPLLPNNSVEGDVYYVECHECGYHGPDAATEAEARRLWSRRAQQERVR